MRVLVTGSSHWPAPDLLRQLLGVFYGGPETVLVVPDDRHGVAALARECWLSWGGVVEAHGRHTEDQEPLSEEARAARMLDRVDMVLTFLHRVDRRGTLCARLAAQAGVPSMVFRLPQGRPAASLAAAPTGAAAAGDGRSSVC